MKRYCRLLPTLLALQLLFAPMVLAAEAVPAGEAQGVPEAGQAAGGKAAAAQDTSPVFAAAISAGAPLALMYTSVLLSSSPDSLAPWGFGAGQLYAGDPWRALLVSGGAVGVTYGALNLPRFIAGVRNPGPDEGFEGEYRTLSTLFQVVGIGTYYVFSAADAYVTAARQNGLRQSPQPPETLEFSPFDLRTHEIGVMLGASRFDLLPFPIPHVGLHYAWAGGPALSAHTNLGANSVRADFELGSSDIGQLGFAFAGGFTNDTINPVTRYLSTPIFMNEYQSWDYFLDTLLGRIDGPWIQPAITATIGGTTGPARLHLLWGPIFNARAGLNAMVSAPGVPAGSPTKWLTPLLIVATPMIGLSIRTADWLDVTVGGYSLFGVRLRFGFAARQHRAASSATP